MTNLLQALIILVPLALALVALNVSDYRRRATMTQAERDQDDAEARYQGSIW